MMSRRKDKKIEYGVYVHCTEEWIWEHAHEYDMTPRELRAAINRGRWAEARSWFQKVLRWYRMIHDQQSAVVALKHMPADFVTGNHYIDEVTGALATTVVSNRSERHEKKCHEIKAVEKARVDIPAYMLANTISRPFPAPSLCKYD